MSTVRWMVSTLLLLDHSSLPKPPPALPGIGHACGHNLIAICGVGIALAIRDALVHFDLPGKVVLLGTPGSFSPLTRPQFTEFLQRRKVGVASKSSSIEEGTKEWIVV